MDLRVAPVTVHTQAAENLRHAILSGHFVPGQRLVEAELCRVLGVSRGSVREALRRLEAEKLITIVPNRGPSVTRLDWNEAQQIYQVRALLEGEAAALAASAVTAKQRDTMQKALVAFDVAVDVDDAAGRVTATALFYDEIHAACGNAIIEEMLRGLHARINLLRSRSMSRPGRARNSSMEMWAIYEAIKASDPEAARAAAVAHVNYACVSVRCALLDPENEAISEGALR